MQVIGRMKGRELEGRTYEPILPYYEHLKATGAFRVREPLRWSLFMRVVQKSLLRLESMPTMQLTCHHVLCLLKLDRLLCVCDNA